MFGRKAIVLWALVMAASATFSCSKARQNNIQLHSASAVTNINSLRGVAAADAERRAEKRNDAEETPNDSDTRISNNTSAIFDQLSIDSASPCSDFKTGIQMGKLFEGISEVSGLACSTMDPNVLWIHEDSGAAAMLYAIDVNGELRGKWRLDTGPTTISAYDWEDIAVQPRSEGTGYIWIGDIGDNLARESNGQQGRNSIQVIRAKEPVIAGVDNTVEGRLDEVSVFEFTYPERPFDAEALTVDPVTGDLYIFTKVPGGDAPVFVARAPVKSGQLQKAGTVSVPWITAADFAANGRELLVRNYLFALHWERTDTQTWPEAIIKKTAAVALRLELQGESIGFLRDASGFYTVSEGASAPVYFYKKACNPDTPNGSTPTQH